jgi:hypothetical protein
MKMNFILLVHKWNISLETNFAFSESKNCLPTNLETILFPKE